MQEPNNYRRYIFQLKRFNTKVASIATVASVFSTFYQGTKVNLRNEIEEDRRHV